HRVRIAAAPRVPAQDQNCVVVLTLPLPVAAGAGPLAPVDLLHRIGGFFRLLGLCLAGVEVRPDEQALPGQNSRQGH
ncbi:Helix-turn-helix domain, partial [Dysosmobacter welbionis]